MDSLAVPIVTEDDLLKFHTSHLGKPFPSGGLMAQADHIMAETSYDDDLGKETDEDLGYYPDGVKRTLTDDQISMFRHTEIQSLLREKREREEGSNQSQQQAQDGPETAARTLLARPNHKRDAREQDSDEEEYTKFLEAERKEFQKTAAQKRNGERTTYEPDDRTISTRRRVREMDSFQATNDVLMYDDEPAPASHESKEYAEQSKNLNQEGRKIWFPMIG